MRPPTAGPTVPPRPHDIEWSAKYRPRNLSVPSSPTSAWCAGPWKHSPIPKTITKNVTKTNAIVASSQ
jgi:hypothetical protein